MSLTVNPLLNPTGNLCFTSTFEGGLIERGGRKGREKGLIKFSKMYQRGARFLEDGLVVTGRYTAFSNNKKMVTIL